MPERFARPYYLLTMDGKPIRTDDVLEWAQWFETADRVVRQTDLGPRGTVSTVFLAFDHSWGLGSPVLWETMVFGGPFDERQERYASREAAVAGHDRIVLELVYLKAAKASPVSVKVEPGQVVAGPPITAGRKLLLEEDGD